MSAAAPRLRCAVYTRKSSEEGLDQAFNSLDAQREAGEDFIRSQRHQGWTLVEARYDDGGVSGGTVQRPALQRLLADIAAGRIDAVVVYKVDRLSRSLTDFARLMQAFDERGVCFISVTQQFNTTTSMGRLTLNMLLSFAQFEREVAGERIRDKIAATKRKGRWVCGRPPLGYRLSDPRPGSERRLLIIPQEAEVVRAIFRGYLERRSLVGLANHLNALGHRTRGQDGALGRPLDNTFIYRALTNPIYIGKITHTPGTPAPGTPGSPGTPAPGSQTAASTHGTAGVRGQSGAESFGGTHVWDGLHEPIIDAETWDAVHALMTRCKRASASSPWTHTHLLKGLLRTSGGDAMSPSSVKAARTRSGGTSGGVKGRYYVSQRAIRHGYASCPIKSVSAPVIDDLVRGMVLDHLRDRGADLRHLDAGHRDREVRGVIEAVTLAPDSIVARLRRDAIEALRARCRARAKVPSADPSPRCLFHPEVEEGPTGPALRLAIEIKRHDGKRMLLGPGGRDLFRRVDHADRPEPNARLVQAFGLAYAWRGEALGSGEPLDRVARRMGTASGRLHTLLRLTHLSPRIAAAALSGTLPASIILKDLLAAADHLDWARQEAALGLPEQRR